MLYFKQYALTYLVYSMFEKTDAEIENAQREKQSLMTSSFSALESHEREERSLFLMLSIASLATALVSFSVSNSAHIPILAHFSTVLSIMVCITCAGNNINLLEKHSARFNKHYNKSLEKLNRKLYVLEQFRIGAIDTDEIRKLYHDQSKLLKPSEFSEQPKSFFIWIAFTAFSTSLVSLVLAFL